MFSFETDCQATFFSMLYSKNKTEKAIKKFQKLKIFF